MPDIAALHPQVVHFVVASLFIGLPLYLLAFIPRLRVLRVTALILLVIGVGAAWVAFESGDQAHEPAEDIPGARAAVEEHEEWGERTAIFFSVLLVAQILSFFVQRAAERRAETAVEPVEYDPEALPPGHLLRTSAKGLTMLVAVGWAEGSAYSTKPPSTEVRSSTGTRAASVPGPEIRKTCSAC